MEPKRPANGVKYATLPPEERPRAVTLAALRKLRIGPLFPRDAGARLFSGMRGTPRSVVSEHGNPPEAPTASPITDAYRTHRAVRRRIANASRRRNR